LPDTPYCTVDVVITNDRDEVLLIERANPPHGWALPGGFVDRGERLDTATRREAGEETGLALTGLEQFAAYSDPARDPRGHTVWVVYLATARGEPRADSDAAGLAWFPWDELPPLAFDHGTILTDAHRYRQGGGRPRLP
jgi:ADP-ribose pyrophosphatase YjhB (NUDIX family)